MVHLSGEHGIGTSKAPYMSIAFTDAEMNLFKSIKKAFDPNNILNPFKMGLGLIEMLKRVFDFFNDDTPYYAASLSFFTIFAILPLLALLIVIISNIPTISQHLDKIMLYILDFINPTHSATLSVQIGKFLENTSKLGYIGIVYLLFVFTMFFKDYEYIVNKIHGVNARPIYKSFFLYLSFLICNSSIVLYIYFFINIF